MDSKSKEVTGRYISPKIIQRARVLIVIMLVMSLVLLYDLIVGKVLFCPALGALLAGVLIGWVSSRMQYFSWDADEGKIITSMDWVGGVILVLYIAFSFFKSRLLSHLVADSSQVMGMGLALSVGSFAGRLQGMKWGLLYWAKGKRRAEP